MSKMESSRNSFGAGIPLSNATTKRADDDSSVCRTISKLGLQRRGFLDQSELMEAMNLEEPVTPSEQYRAISQLKLQSRGFLCREQFVDAMNTDEVDVERHRNANLGRIVCKLGQALTALEHRRRS